ncbi:MAG: PQQ-dependent sugar dehydrogenase [Imperialibacter sp.]|uniref:PQQ-dependent sugar dehydrogenase n=1 Tax=Imperialibacter sp. TaxID=2038411 RepID=UPI0032EB19B9
MALTLKTTSRSALAWVAAILVLVQSCKQTETQNTNEPPEDNRFTKVVLTEGMDEPMEMTFLPNSRVLFVERKGGVKILDENTGEVTLVATIPVNTKYTNKEGRVREAEEGLMGVIAHPNYKENSWIYMYYADPDTPKHVLARWELRGDSLYASTKKVVLEVPTQREECCHTGGGMVFDKEGNLFLTVGNNTVNPRTGSSNLDERPGMESSDDQRAPGNTNDLRGKILRIHPEADGSYTIPEGNLFPEGTEKTRPEIYTMGHRNPWRPTLDSKTGYLYWGEVGPDASVDSVWGPKGYDEFNQAKGPGFFGWPYFIANNRAYNRHDLATDTYGEPFDVNHPVNESVNNTGLKELPTPVVPAFIYYPYGPSDTFPLVGTAGRSATGGPVFRKADFAGASRPFPSYFEGKWLIVEFMRGWIMSATMDENGDYQSMERFLPNESFVSAIDMDFGPSGDLYVLEYGSAWFRGNSNSRIVKIEYNAGNRKPIVAASIDKAAGAVPFTAQLSSEGTTDYDDYDQGKLSYEWKVVSDGGINKTLTEANPSFNFEQAGTYQVSLTVTDTKGEKNRASMEVVAGNEPPTVSIDFQVPNRSFYFGEKSLTYTVSVSDKEDGSSADGTIKPNEVAVTFDYVPSGYDPIEIASKQRGAESMAALNIGKNLIETSDCKSCHQYEQASIGPAYNAVATKYPKTDANINMLVGKIINGGSGVWGEHAMSAHPQLSQADAKRMVMFILNMLETKPTVESLPLSGTVTPQVPEGEDGQGGYLLRASYADKGAGTVGPLSGDDFVALRNPSLDPQQSEIRKGVNLLTTPGTTFNMVGSGSYIGYKDIDLTGIKQIDLFVQASPRVSAAGGYVEVHLDSPTGTLLGTTNTVGQKNVGFGRPAPGEDMVTWRRKRNSQAQAKIQATEGIHDVYFVFKSDTAAPDQVLVQIAEILFLNEEAAPLEVGM